MAGILEPSTFSMKLVGDQDTLKLPSGGFNFWIFSSEDD